MRVLLDESAFESPGSGYAGEFDSAGDPASWFDPAGSGYAGELISPGGLVS